MLLRILWNLSLKGVFTKIEREYKAYFELNWISIATNFTFIYCVYMEKMGKNVLYLRGVSFIEIHRFALFHSGRK